MCALLPQQASSSIGRASVSKTEGWGFETLLACHNLQNTVKTGSNCHTMSAQSEATGSALDTVFLWVAVAIVAGSIFGFYYFEPQFNALVRVAGMLAGIGLALLVALQSLVGKAAWAVVRDSRNELRKVVWPTRPETLQTTAIILVVVLILGIMLWGVDSLLLLALEFLTGRGS